MLEEQFSTPNSTDTSVSDDLKLGIERNQPELFKIILYVKEWW